MQEEDEGTEIEETAQTAEAEAAPEPTESTPPQPSDELKVVIIMKADRIMLGVQAPDCDPVYKLLKGSLELALEEAPALVAEAKQKWESNPRNKQADLPKPAPSPTPVRTSAASQPAKKPNQPVMF